MTKQETYDYLNSLGIDYEVTEHTAVFNMEELDAFVRDDKKRNYYLITVKGDKRVDLKAFQQTFGTRRLTFASAEDLMAVMGLIPGAVTPLGLLCDEERKVIFYLDKAFMGGLAGVHPNDNTATVWLKTEDLVKIIQDHGNRVNIAEL